MSTQKSNYNEPSRPRLDPQLKDRITALANRLKIDNMPLSNINNILCSIGLECLERSVDSIADEIKNKITSNDFLKQLVNSVSKDLTIKP